MACGRQDRCSGIVPVAPWNLCCCGAWARLGSARPGPRLPVRSRLWALRLAPARPHRAHGPPVADGPSIVARRHLPSLPSPPRLNRVPLKQEEPEALPPPDGSVSARNFFIGQTREPERGRGRERGREGGSRVRRRAPSPRGGPPAPRARRADPRGAVCVRGARVPPLFLACLGVCLLLPRVCSSRGAGPARLRPPPPPPPPRPPPPTSAAALFRLSSSLSVHARACFSVCGVSA